MVKILDWSKNSKRSNLALVYFFAEHLTVKINEGDTLIQQSLHLCSLSFFLKQNTSFSHQLSQVNETIPDSPGQDPAATTLQVKALEWRHFFLLPTQTALQPRWTNLTIAASTLPLSSCILQYLHLLSFFTVFLDPPPTQDWSKRPGLPAKAWLFLADKNLWITLVQQIISHDREALFLKLCLPGLKHQLLDHQLMPQPPCYQQ